MRSRLPIVVAALVIGCGGSRATPPAAASTTATASPPPDEAAPAVTGVVAASFRLPREDGPGDLGLPNGKVTVLAFLATWNEPAKKSLPKMQELLSRHPGGEVAMYGIFVDDEPTFIREFGQSHGAKFPLAWDKGHEVSKKLRPQSMPAFFVLDAKGTIRAIHRGYHDGKADDIARDVDALLGK